VRLEAGDCNASSLAPFFSVEISPAASAASTFSALCRPLGSPNLRWYSAVEHSIGSNPDKSCGLSDGSMQHHLIS